MVRVYRRLKTSARCMGRGVIHLSRHLLVLSIHSESTPGNTISRTRQGYGSLLRVLRVLSIGYYHGTIETIVANKARRVHSDVKCGQGGCEGDLTRASRRTRMVERGVEPRAKWSPPLGLYLSGVRQKRVHRRLSAPKHSDG